MPKTFRVSVAGGIDAVADLAALDAKGVQDRVAYMENLDVRGGIARPYNLPLLNPNVTVPQDSVQVYSYRGRLLFSSVRRDYTADYINDRERIYWTEYGGNPMKMIEGTTVPLGTICPASSPMIESGQAVAPANVQAVTGAGGSLPSGTSASFRLAYRTPLGVFPPSGSVQTKVSADDSQITLTWDNPTVDLPILETLLFLGIVGGDEKLLTTLAARATSFDYLVNSTASGEQATSYDQQYYYQYCVTYLRNVNGVEDESGPCAPTPPIESISSRNIVISPWSEGILDSPNTVTWAPPVSFELIPGSSLPGSGSGNAISVDSIVLETDTDRVLCTFNVPHYFVDGERILIRGCAGVPFGVDTNGNILPVEIQVEEGMYTTCYLVVGADFQCPGASLTGVTAYRTMVVDIETMGYNTETGVVEVMTIEPHTFGAERVQFEGFADPRWNGEIVVLADPNLATRFFVDNMSMPTGTTSTTGPTGATGTTYGLSFTGCSARRSLTCISTTGNTAGTTMPIIGDILYMDMSTPATIKTALTVLATPENAFLVNSNITGATVGGSSYSSGIQYVPHNDYLTHRRLYRAGGTGLFQMVKELRLDELVYLDAIPDASLGQVLPTLYEEEDVDVVFGPAPWGLAGLIQHYNMGFAFDPSNNRLRWTPLGCMDAWPEEFYMNFDHRILALWSFNQACQVFCEDGIYRIEGTSPTSLMRHKSLAAPCRAGGSVQFINNRLIYLGDQGLMSYDGQNAMCLTDLKIPSEFWLANSRYLSNSEPGCYLVPFTQNAAFERLRGPDLPSKTPRCLMPYLAHHVNQRGIRSFIYRGKYYLYWGGDFSEYDAQTMVCVDLT